MPARLRRAVAAGATALTVGTICASGAGAEEGSFEPATLRAVPGKSFAVKGSGCHFDGKPADAAHVSISQRAGSPGFHHRQRYRPNDDGTWAGTFTVPADAPLGPYSLRNTCEAADFGWNRHNLAFEVVDPATTTTSRRRPATTTTRQAPAGATTTAPTTAASLASALALLVVRRRRSAMDSGR